MALLVAVTLASIAVARGATTGGQVGARKPVARPRPAQASFTSAALIPPLVPSTGAYLGAFVAPHADEVEAQADVRIELAQLGDFDGAMGRPLGLVHVYQSWFTPVKVSTLAALSATGATPMIDWTCTSDAAIIDGSQDNLITSYAKGLKNYGRPVFLRWFWEMNLTGLPRTAGCLGSAGSAGYIAAWKHIWTIFQAQGATNVAFVWCPSISNTAVPFYPGDAYVNWIGWDGYDRKQNPTTILQSQFLTFYNAWVGHGKPMVIGETGATTDQQTYLTDLATELPILYPHVHAVLYYDSKSASDWTLVNTPGQQGLSQFVAMGQNPYFGFPYTGG